MILGLLSFKIFIMKNYPSPNFNKYQHFDILVSSILQLFLLKYFKANLRIMSFQSLNISVCISKKGEAFSYITTVPLSHLVLFYFIYFFKRFIYLFNLFLAASGLSCGTRDLRWGMQDLLLWRAGSSLWCAGFSLIVTCGFSLSSCGSQAPGHVGSVVCGTRAQLPHGMWDPSSLTRDRTHIPCIARRTLYHWTTREVPLVLF